MSNLETSTNQSIDRAFLVMEELSRFKDGLGVSELARQIDLPKSTTYRVLSALVVNGYARQDKATERYKLGYKVLHLAGTIMENMDLRTIARPHIEALARETGQIVHLATMEEGVAFYVDKVQGSMMNISMYSNIGREIPLYCTGVGKILLSGLDFEQVKKLVPESSMVRYTANTITTHERLKNELQLIRERGYGFDEIEHEEDIRCVAAPIHRSTGEVVASISLTGLIKYVSIERLPELIELTTRTARAISRELGYVKK